MNLEPIGIFHGGAARKYEAPRQGVFAGGGGCVELAPGRNFEMALRDLEGFERIWLIFVFDRNGDGWRPTAHPPVTAPGVPRVGVFASRAPYRPNPIGLSCVRLVGVRGRVVEVEEADLLDGTPVLDIKPYIPAADAFPGAKAGWVEAQEHWRVEATPAFTAAAAFVRDAGGPDLLATATLQLAGEPFDSSRKRVMRTGEATGVFSVRMFRLDFTVDAAARRVELVGIRSGYTPEELAAEDDPHADKALHRAFVARVR
ncbi:MAG: tRNA (N6-threonylcarbamoyladenosine(37)-N6)-methyltransferase TrmO [Kiritimatiellia bacterium]